MLSIHLWCLLLIFHQSSFHWMLTRIIWVLKTKVLIHCRHVPFSPIKTCKYELSEYWGGLLRESLLQIRQVTCMFSISTWWLYVWAAVVVKERYLLIWCHFTRRVKYNLHWKQSSIHTFYQARVLKLYFKRGRKWADSICAFSRGYSDIKMPGQTMQCC